MLTEDEIARRIPVWDELARLFLDTDYLGIVGAAQIAERIKGHGYDRETLELMMFEEVMPAFAFNLRSIAGEWTDWDRDDLVARVTTVMQWPRWKRSIASLGVTAYSRAQWKIIAREL